MSSEKSVTLSEEIDLLDCTRPQAEVRACTGLLLMDSRCSQLTGESMRANLKPTYRIILELRAYIIRNILNPDLSVR